MMFKLETHQEFPVVFFWLCVEFEVFEQNELLLIHLFWPGIVLQNAKLAGCTEFFLPQNGFSKHFAVLKNDFITPKSRLMIHNAKVPYHRLPLINPSKPQFFFIYNWPRSINLLRHWRQIFSKPDIFKMGPRTPETFITLSFEFHL